VYIVVSAYIIVGLVGSSLSQELYKLTFKLLQTKTTTAVVS